MWLDPKSTGAPGNCHTELNKPRHRVGCKSVYWGQTPGALTRVNNRSLALERTELDL